MIAFVNVLIATVYFIIKYIIILIYIKNNINFLKRLIYIFLLLEFNNGDCDLFPYTFH